MQGERGSGVHFLSVLCSHNTQQAILPLRQSFWCTGKRKGLFWGFQPLCKIQISFSSSWLAQVLMDFAVRLSRAPHCFSLCTMCGTTVFCHHFWADPQTLVLSYALLLSPASSSLVLYFSLLQWIPAYSTVPSLSFPVAHPMWHLHIAFSILSGKKSLNFSSVCQLLTLLLACQTGPSNLFCYNAHQYGAWPDCQVKDQANQKKQ